MKISRRTILGLFPVLAVGFAIERRYVIENIEGARRDGLMTRRDFAAAMNEQLQNWENDNG